MAVRLQAFKQIREGHHLPERQDQLDVLTLIPVSDQLPDGPPGFIGDLLSPAPFEAGHPGFQCADPPGQPSSLMAVLLR